jgi:hypothetical protein
MSHSLRTQTVIDHRKKKLRTVTIQLAIYLAVVTPKPRSVWKRERNPSSSWWSTTPQRSWFSSIDFGRTYRLKRSTFEILCAQLAPYVQGKHTKLRDPVPLHVRVAMFVERCATGNTFYTIGKNYDYPDNTVHKIYDEVADAFQKYFLPTLVSFPTSIEGLQRLASAFAKRRGLLNCVGAVDGKCSKSCTQVSSILMYHVQEATSLSVDPTRHLWPIAIGKGTTASYCKLLLLRI